MDIQKHLRHAKKQLNDFSFADNVLIVIVGLIPALDIIDFLMWSLF